MATRTRKARKCCVFLREPRPERLDATFQDTLAATSRAAPGGQEPVAAGILALAPLWQAYGHVGDRDAVALTVMDKRWQRVLACLGAEQPSFRQSTLWNFRRRLMAHNLDTILLERTVTVAEPTGGFGARHLRAALDSTPLFGAGRVEETWHLRGHALRKAGGLAARALGVSAAARREDAGLVLVGPRSLKAALDRDWGQPKAREQALRLGLEEVERWQTWLAQHQRLVEEGAPLKDVMDTLAQIVPQDPAPAPDAGPGGQRIKQHVAPERRISLEDADRRHGRKSSAKTFNGFQEHCVLDLESHVPRAVVGRPANEPEQEAVELLVETWEPPPGLLPRDIALGYMARPRMAPWAEQGVSIMARPWPQGGTLFTKDDFPLAFAHGTVTCPGGQSVPMVPGKDAPCPASACDGCPPRAQCTTARIGQGRSRHIREDEPFQPQRRTTIKTKRGRASLRTRTAVEHASSPPLAHQGRRARYTGLRKNPFDGRRPAAVRNLQVAAH